MVEPALSDRRIDFRELNARCNRVAHALRGAGVKPGDRVALLLMNGAEFIESFFAVAKIGAVNVPLNWRLVADELEFILKDSGATVLLYAENFAPLVAELQRRGDEDRPAHLCVQVGGTRARPSRWTTTPGWARCRHDEPALAGADDDLLFIMYTSGTTGLPKGVMHSHRTVLWAMLTRHRHGRLPLQRPLPDRAAAVPRRRADAGAGLRLPGHHAGHPEGLRPEAGVGADPRREDQHHAAGAGDAAVHAGHLRQGDARCEHAALGAERRRAGAGEPDQDLCARSASRSTRSTA